MRCLLIVAVVLAAPAAVQSQEPVDSGIGSVLRRWAFEFDAGAIDPAGDFEDDIEVYGATVDAGGVLLRYRRSAQQFSNLRVLEKLVEAVEQQPDGLGVFGLLEIGGVGLDRSPFDADVQLIRDLGASAAARVMRESPMAVGVVHRVAAGGWLDQWDDDWERCLPARISALQLSARVDAAWVAEVLTDAILDADPRVRLAGAESLRVQAAAGTLGAVVAAIADEGHPVVAQALVQTVGAVLDRHGDELPRETRDRAVAAALGIVGRVGWRTDVEVVELAGRHPIREAVPALIELLDGRPGSRVRARDRDFGPLLAERAWTSLRRITGTLLPRDDADAWREFWAREGASVEMVSRPLPSGARTTSGGFFGIEVRGRESAFVLDVSKSMHKRIGSRSGAGPSRIEAAGLQLLAVVQDMPRSWRFRVFTFADEVREWNVRGARADSRTLRALTAFLQQQTPGGRTNLVGALERALRIDDLRFGVEARNSIDELFVLSDGMPSDADGPVDEQALLAWVREVNRYQSVRIHTVLAGGGPGEAFLRELAAQNGGEFVQR